MVEAAQAKLAEHYFKRVDEATPNDSSAAGGYSFSDAIDAVSVIEYQCTREGIRTLLNRTVTNTPTNMAVDPATGTIVFKSALDATIAAIDDERRTPTGSKGGNNQGGGNGKQQKPEETDADKTVLLKDFVAQSENNKNNLANFVRAPPLRDLPHVKAAFPTGVATASADQILAVVLNNPNFSDVRGTLLSSARRVGFIAKRQ